MRPYDILSPGLRTHGDHGGPRIEGVFAAGPVPNYGTKRIRGSILLPGRISSKGPASMRDASDLHLVLRCRCPRFTSRAVLSPFGSSTYRSLHHCATSTQRLLCMCLLFLSLFLSHFLSLSLLFFPPFFYWVSSHPHHRDVICVSLVIALSPFCLSCCDGGYIQKGCVKTYTCNVFMGVAYTFR